MTVHELMETAKALPAIPGLFCTIGAPAAPCGKPAVVEFTARGKRLGECVEHAAPFALREALTGTAREAEIAVGARVRVFHGGIVKEGVVEAVGRTLLKVRVPVVRTGGTKVIERPIAEVER